MNIKKSAHLWLCLCLISGTIVYSEDEKSSESDEPKKIVSQMRSLYDALTWVNRMPEEMSDGETPLQFSGRLLGRVASHESRNLLKLPTGMTRDTYLAMKTFFRYEGDSSVGNCAACHTPMQFESQTKHIMTKGGAAQLAPSVRNIAVRNLDLEKILKTKIKAAEQKKDGSADDLDDAFSIMTITEKDIPGLVSFLESLNDASFVDFRKMIVEVEPLDTSDIF